MVELTRFDFRSLIYGLNSERRIKWLGSQCCFNSIFGFIKGREYLIVTLSTSSFRSKPFVCSHPLLSLSRIQNTAEGLYSTCLGTLMCWRPLRPLGNSSTMILLMDIGGMRGDGYYGHLEVLGTVS